VSTTVKVLRRRFESEKHRSTAIANPLDWWSGCDKIFEILQPAVRMFLAVPASNAVAERGFSNAGFLAEGRPQMTEEMLDDLAVVRHQLQALRESGMPEVEQRKLTEDKLTELVNDIRKRFDLN